MSQHARGGIVPGPGPYVLDPHWEWVEITTFSDRSPRYVRGHCNHLDTVPVESVLGELVARLCLTCDAQLPAGRQPWR